MEKSRTELLDECRRTGYVRYSRLNVQQLKNLLECGYHYISPKRESYLFIHSSRGAKPDEFDPTRYCIDCKPCRNGHLVRGIDLEGMFDSQFVPDRRVQLTVHDFIDIPAMDEQLIRVYRLIYGGWYIPASMYEPFTVFRQNLVAIPPRSLQELALNVVTSKKIVSLQPNERRLIRRVHSLFEDTTARTETTY